jgi:hypothetical protein
MWDFVVQYSAKQEKDLRSFLGIAFTPQKKGGDANERVSDFDDRVLRGQPVIDDV